MSFDAVAEIARAVLYEGYLLYPYRPTALKNQQRWMFGRLLPREYCLAQGESDPWKMQTECLLTGSSETEVQVSIRFLQLIERGSKNGDAASSETIERIVNVAVNVQKILDLPHSASFEFEPVLHGAVTMKAATVAPGLFKLTVLVENHTPNGNAYDLNRALFRALLSTHKLLKVCHGEFISLFDPPEMYRAAAACCCNMGAWPVLIGPQTGKMMLSAPIILYDYPRVAPESPGDLFDNTEIDELLSLRIQTLTDAEKREMAAASEHARSVLERTEALSEAQLLQLHGRLQYRPSLPQHVGTAQEKAIRVSADREFSLGRRVRLCPGAGTDAIDILLRGQTGTIASVKCDFEDRVHLGIVLDEDPGADFGLEGRPGHQFFYGPEEVELL